MHRSNPRPRRALAEVATAAHYGGAALAETPDLLPKLRAAGVVDVGGSGFLLHRDPPMLSGVSASTMLADTASTALVQRLILPNPTQPAPPIAVFMREISRNPPPRPAT